MWERACSRWHRCGLPDKPRRQHRRQASSTGFALLTKFGSCRVIMWERACSRWHRCGLPDKPRRQHRRQASSHRFCAIHKIRTLPGSLCGSGLARDGIHPIFLTRPRHQPATESAVSSQLNQPVSCPSGLSAQAPAAPDPWAVAADRSAVTGSGCHFPRPVWARRAG